MVVVIVVVVVGVVVVVVVGVVVVVVVDVVEVVVEEVVMHRAQNGGEQWAVHWQMGPATVFRQIPPLRQGALAQKSGAEKVKACVSAAERRARARAEEYS